MTVGLQRASLFAVTKETVPGEYKKPSIGKEFLPIRPGNELAFEPEMLESDELLNDIGASKGFIGKEAVSGSHVAYLRHSGVEGTEPQLGIMYESVLGSKYINATEKQTQASSTVSVLKVADGTLHRVGEALLIKDASNGYSIRNIKAIVGNDLFLNFNLNVAPAAGVKLGKAVLYKPEAQGHPAFSTTKYLGNGYAIEASSGNTGTELSLTADANGLGEVNFSFEGVKYLYNAVIIDALNKSLKFTDDAGTFTVSVPEKVYSTPIDLAAALEASMNGASEEVHTVTYDNKEGKFTIASTSVVFSLLLTESTIGEVLGFDDSADLTGAVTYTSNNAQAYEATVVPEYDAADIIIIKGAELLVGTETDNMSLKAQSVTLKVSKEVEDVESIAAESGIEEKIPTKRVVEMNITTLLKKHDASLLDALLKNKGISAMLNAGPKVGGNFVAGKCFNAYLKNCTVTGCVPQGDSFLQVEIALKGFVDTNSKDIYVNFV